jgi:predicted DCC family thiol-disulfide oxidoreductase YuxK
LVVEQNGIPQAQIDRPVMLYDGRCPFCCRWIARWRHITRNAIDFQPYQEVAARFPQIQLESLGRAVHLVEPDGRVDRGAAAVFRSFELANSHRWLAWSCRHIWGFAAAADWGYATIASHRTAADRIDLLLIGSTTQPQTYRLTQQIFLRLLAVIYAIAFLSLLVQIDGLIGSAGILPITRYLAAAQSVLGTERYRLLPTLCWFNTGDGFLHLLCGGGVAAALLVVCGLAQLPAFVLMWAFYLSLTVAGQDFLEFQWDSLLLEAGFLAIFFASWRILAARRPEPSRILRWLLRWLLFRVMFMSGVVKLSSGDVAWRAWAAMRYHYETQPLPTWIGWYFFQLPSWFQTFSCGVVFLAELLVPPLIFGPRRIRLVAFWAIIVFQLLILATGNYGFFNLLTIVLCFTLPDDTFWRWLFRLKAPQYVAVSLPRLRRWVHGAVAIVLLSVTIPICVDAFGMGINWPTPVAKLDSWIEPFRIANGYGLFAIMTTQRPEILIEGSDDGTTWKPYSFKWKPGDVNRAPAFVTPHMPRLDWQMWFAALDGPSSSPWIVPFVDRLLEGSPAVLRLLEHNPFPDHPPQYIRAVLYDYHFTSRATHRITGAWWRRRAIGLYYQTSRRSPPDSGTVLPF